MLAFVIQHQFWVAVVLSWIFSAAVSSMPDPGPDASPVYAWLFRFLHTIAGNITTAFANKFSGTKMLILLITIPLIVSSSACAAIHYTVHPGAHRPNSLRTSSSGLKHWTAGGRRSPEHLTTAK
jgi:hypothetical protein